MFEFKNPKRPRGEMPSVIINLTQRQYHDFVSQLSELVHKVEPGINIGLPFKNINIVISIIAEEIEKINDNAKG